MKNSQVAYSKNQRAIIDGVVLAVIVALTAASPMHALTINPTFDPSIAANFSPTNAASFVAAINYADAQYQNAFSDPITINITFAASPGTGILGQSSTFLYSTNYAGVKAALTADKKTADDATAVANLPTSDPTGGARFFTSTAEAKALGLLARNDPATDGTITLGAGFTYTYNPNNRAVPGAIDFIGVAEHEISEVMGRIGINGGIGGSYSLLDLFAYTGPGALDLANNQPGTFFSINGGNTLLKSYNNHSNGGDQKDWASGTNDSYNAFATFGVKEDISAVDLREMDVIGYDRILAPEPSSLILFGLGTLGLFAIARRRRKA